MPTRILLELINGTNFHKIFWYTYDDENLVIPAGSEATFTVRENATDEDPYVIQKQNAAAGGSDSEMLFTSPGKLELWLVPADTVDLDPGDYIYDIQTVISGETHVHVMGTLRITKGVTS